VYNRGIVIVVLYKCVGGGIGRRLTVSKHRCICEVLPYIKLLLMWGANPYPTHPLRGKYEYKQNARTYNNRQDIRR
jgi:hypothetical protein